MGLQDGWPLLAQHMAQTPEFESFRRFRELNIKNLLYYQAELATLEADLKQEEKDDFRRDDSYARSAEMLMWSCDDPDATAEQKKQVNIVLKIRKILREYNKALLQYNSLSALPQPDEYNVETLRLWIKRGFGGGASREAIRGNGSAAWGDINKTQGTVSSLKRFLPMIKLLFWPDKKDLDPKSPCRDLLRVQPCRDLDSFTQWVEYEFMPFWHELRHGEELTSYEDRRKDQVKHYSQSTMLRFTSFVTTVVACLLPTLAIAILTTAKTTRDKLLYIGGFTAMFAIGLLWLTEAGSSRLQVFTATAAFSAVLVVFVQGQ